MSTQADDTSQDEASYFAHVLEAMELLPEPSCAQRFASRPELRLLVRLCATLQGLSRTGDFILTARAAGKLIGLSHTAAHAWLQTLCSPAFRILQRTHQGKGDPVSGDANRYRFIAE
jgi:hypothetical protein